VNPAEAAVAEHAHDVATLRVFRDVRKMLAPLRN